jgi:hypothetical protein
MTRPLRVTFGPVTFLLGACLTVFIFGLPHGGFGYFFGTGAALLLGMPLALLTGILMRPVRNQVLHILAVGAAGLVTGTLTLMALAGAHWYTLWGLVLWTGFCAALGRAAVVTLVTVHDAPARGEAVPAATALEP